MACVRVGGNEPLSMDSFNTDKSNSANLPIKVLRNSIGNRQGLGLCKIAYIKLLD